jgi:choline monooxygenase
MTATDDRTTDRRHAAKPGRPLHMTGPAPADLFNPAHYEAVRRPVSEAANLPPWCYTSEAFFERELDRLFRKAWNFVGRAERVPAPGDFFTADIARIPILVVRGTDGVVRAFANTCRHRGSIVARGEGHTRSFACPYHAWTYGLSGELLSAPTEMETSVGFCAEDHGLVPVRLDSWGGFMFVSFDPDGETLTQHLGNLPTLLGGYACDDLRLVRRLDFDVRCNWKFYVENLKDAQHVSTVHRNSISRYASPGKYWREVQPTSGNIISTFMGYPGSAALLQGDTGFPFIPTLDPERIGTTAPLIFPNLYISCTVDCAWYVHVDPVAVDRIRLEQGALFPKDVVARADFSEIIPKYLRRFDMTQAEDNEISELQHRGVSSPYSRQGRYSVKEALVHKTVNWILDRVLDPA